MFKPFASSAGKKIRSNGNRTRLLLAVSTAILAAIVFTLASVAANDAIPPRSNRQQASQSASTPAQANKTYTLYTGFWRTDGSFVSTIRVKNVLAVAPIDVTPVLFMADGTPHMLSSVHIAVSGVATVNVNDALAKVPSSIARHVSQFGSAALIYSYPSPGHVTAQVAAIDASRSLSYTYPFAASMNMPRHDSKQILEGLWWKHDSGVTGFVTLSNTTDQQQIALLTSVHPGNNLNSQQVTLAPHSTQMLKLEDITTDASSPDNRAGGIRVEYEGSQGNILVTGALANESEGYSANMPFWPRDMSSSSPTPTTYASAGLMLGKPDPMMMPGFPKETTLSAYLSLRNTTEKPLDVALQLNYMSAMGMEGSMPVTRNLPAQHLAPFEARQVDLQGPLNAAGLKNFSGSINLSLSFTGKGGDLVLATGSVDQTGTYVFEVEPESVDTFRSKNATYWGVAQGNDTMFTLWNPTSTPQHILVTFYYGDGSGKYTLPVHLDAQASTMIDMAMLIAEIKPDADGNIIPPSVTEGSAQFASAKGRNEKISIVIASGIYNVSTATCYCNCITCCAASNFAITPNPIICPVGGSIALSASAVDCNGYSVYGNYSSSNTAVITFDSSGNAYGVSVGQATINGSLDGQNYTGQLCGVSSCPTSWQYAQATANVTPRIDTISPAQGPVGNTLGVTISGQGFGTNPTKLTVQTGNGITTTVSSAQDNQIGASFAIALNAAGGGYLVFVRVIASDGTTQDSNAVSFYVQIPTYLNLSLGTKVTYNGTDMIECNGQNDGPRWGYSRCATFTLMDQTGTTAITTGSFTATESVPTVSSNPPGLTAKTGGGPLTNGTFQDFWAFVATSSPPPQPGEYLKARQSLTVKDNNASLTYSNVRINCLDFEYNDISVTDITNSGSCQ
jgi:IPT/TIG domain